MKKKRSVSNFIEESFLGDLLSFHLTLHQRIMAYSNILLVVSIFIFTILFNSFIGKNFQDFDVFSLSAMIVLLLSTMFVIILNLLIMLPKMVVSKKNNPLYYMDFVKRLSKEEYEKELYETLKNEENIVKAYADETYDLGKEILLPAFKKIRLCVKILIIGISLATILTIISFILYP